MDIISLGIALGAAGEASEAATEATQAAGEANTAAAAANAAAAGYPTLGENEIHDRNALNYFLTISQALIRNLEKETSSSKTTLTTQGVDQGIDRVAFNYAIMLIQALLRDKEKRIATLEAKVAVLEGYHN